MTIKTRPVASSKDTLEPEAIVAIEKRRISKQRVDYLRPAISKDFGADDRFYDTWTKLIVFSLTEYERVVLLDSDMLVVRNMDELMDIPLDPEGDRVFAASHACVCNPMHISHYPANWDPSNCAFESQHSNPALAQTTGAPSSFGVGMCNSGLLVVVPSTTSFNIITKTLEDESKTSTYNFPDQALISDVFRDRWHPLPYTYNALKTLRWCHKEIWRDEEVKNVHYILDVKPWDKRESEDPTHAWWWKVNDERRKVERRRGMDDGF